MCGIAEFRCRGLTIPANLLDDVMSEFDFERETEKSDPSCELVTITSYHGHCMCDPDEEQRRALHDIFVTLVSHAHEVMYSPNDYSYDPDECFTETLSIAEALEQYWPSLATPPLRVKLIRS